MKAKYMKMFALMVVIVASLTVAAAAEKLLVWDYVPWRIDYFQQYANEYMKLHPNVEIEVQLVAQSEYVSKIQIGVITDTAPAMFSAHPNWIAEFNDMLEPFPTDLFPYDELATELLHYENLIQDDGNVYYYPLGMQGPMLFINEDHWNQAGLGDAPRTWDEAVDLGRKMTRVKDDITQVAGFFFSTADDMMQDVFIDLNYQHGGKIYTADGTEVAFTEPSGRSALNLLMDMYATGVSGRGESLTFQRNEIGMRYGYAWRRQQIVQAPDIRWTTAALPTLSGEAHPGMSGMLYYFGMAVPKGSDPATVRRAFEFLDWVYANDENMMDLNSVSGTLPSRMSLWNYPEIAQDPVLRQLTQTLPYATVPGEFPQWIKDQLAQVRAAIVSGSENPMVTLENVTRQINARLVEEPVQWIAE